VIPDSGLTVTMPEFPGHVHTVIETRAGADSDCGRESNDQCWGLDRPGRGGFEPLGRSSDSVFGPILCLRATRVTFRPFGIARGATPPRSDGSRQLCECHVSPFVHQEDISYTARVRAHACVCVRVCERACVCMCLTSLLCRNCTGCTPVAMRVPSRERACT
jgi:hypothetical protein